MLEIEVDGCYTVAIELYQNQFVAKWQKLFETTASACKINQVECFACRISEQEAQQRLLDSILYINKFLKKNFIEVPNIIDWESQHWYNYLHVQFEKLSGPYGQPTRLFAQAPYDFREAVRALNFYLHRIEIRPYTKFKPWYISFDKNCYKRLPLDHDDYQWFTTTVQPGQVVVHYSELGKTLIDVYKDKLSIDYAGMKNLHYYSAEISICLSDKPICLFPAGFEQWATERNIDVTDKKLGIGALPVGQVQNLDIVRQAVYNGKSITKLRII